MNKEGRSTILIASRNRGKVVELKEILGFPEVEFLDLNQVSFSGRIKEVGLTFEENALIKGEAIYREYHIPVLADDSGLVVPSLRGLPGIYSARFAGEGAGDDENIKLLLYKMKGYTDELREAWFYCAAVFYYAPERYFLATGTVYGKITEEPSGDRGFGYDPVFYLPEYEKTMAQLQHEEKNRISHRARALGKLRELIVKNLHLGYSSS
ncbi:MAG: RdgB/HAM1 family non-canonical purine NTP pyrophosphatase [Spirochaetota bacterium]